MKLYIADTHFGHANAIKFDHRPFADTEEMDAAMIHLWNSRVQKGDDVYILGDFCFRSAHEPAYYLKQLHGTKHLLIGNHDGKLLHDKTAMGCFVSVDQIKRIRDSDHSIVLCHFPIAEWDGARKGDLHIYGHIHANPDETCQYMASRWPGQALNAGCMINNYTPASLRELQENNARFYGKNGSETLFHWFI